MTGTAPLPHQRHHSGGHRQLSGVEQPEASRMSDLYDIDIVLWSEHQATLLRRRAAGQLVNDADLDWLNIAEEVEALGRSERSSLRSKITTVIESPDAA
jgi:hypothetical protein